MEARRQNARRLGTKTQSEARVTLRYSLAGWERSGEILFPACDLGLLEGDWLRCQGFECALAGASALAPAPAWPQSEHREPLTLDGPFVQSSRPESKKKTSLQIVRLFFHKHLPPSSNRG